MGSPYAWGPKAPAQTDWYRNAQNPTGAAKPFTVAGAQQPGVVQGWGAPQKNISLGRNFASPVMTMGADKPMERTYNAPGADPVTTYPQQNQGNPYQVGPSAQGSQYGGWIGGNAANIAAQPAAAPTQGPPGLPNGNSLDYINQYMTPYLNDIINRGSSAIQSSAAAKGLLGSSGTLNDIGDWAAQATQNAWRDAAGLYGQDRTYAAGRSDQAYNQFDRDRGFNYDYYRNEDATRYNRYQDRATAYNKLMANKQSMMTDLAAGGPKAAGVMADMAQALGMSQADLGLAFAKLQSDYAQAQGGNDSGFWESIIPILVEVAPMLIAAA